MVKQCAGCGTIFDDGSGIPNPSGVGTIHGCCLECQKTSFREKEHQAPEPVKLATPTIEEVELLQQVEHWKQRATAAEASLKGPSGSTVTPGAGAPDLGSGTSTSEAEKPAEQPASTEVLDKSKVQ